MKKTRALLLSILLMILAFTSCNLDGTSGIFREIAQSKAPLGIRYKQLLGIKGTDLYFRTAQGVERIESPSTSNSSTRVATSTKGNLIQAAALSSVDNKVFYITNDLAELDSGRVKFVDTTAPGGIPGTIPVTTAEAPSITSELSIKGLYANSMVLVTGKDVGGNVVFDLLGYSSAATNFKTLIASFTAVPTDFGLHAVIQQTTKEHKSLGADSAMLVSFAKSTGPSTGEYEHYLVTNAGTMQIITNTLQVANFLYDSTNGNIYVLSTNGKLYYAGTDASPASSWVELSDSGKTFDTNAFAYAVDGGSGNYHLITKPSLKTSPLGVFTFSQGATTSDGVTFTNVQSGYAKELSLATIVSAQEKSTDPAKLLVATHENGMYDITINEASANVDASSNGSSSAAEVYTF